MSVQVGSACYDTPEAAAAATASAQLGRVVSGGSGLYSIDVVASSATSIEYGFTALDGGPPLPSVVVPFTPPACQLMSWEDGATYGWLVVSAWAAVWAVRFIARQVRE